jgi:hypothetical protein
LLANKTFEQFFDAEKHIFYFTAKSQADVIERSIEVHDNVIPASNSVMAGNLFKLGHLLAERSYLETAEKMLSILVDDLKAYPSGYSNWMQLMLSFTDEHYEVAIAGKQAFEKLHLLQKSFLPNCLFCAGTNANNLTLLKNRMVDGETLIYVCQNNSCQLPVENINDALKLVQPK